MNTDEEFVKKDFEQKRQDHIQDELNVAIQKRILVTEMTNKKNNKITTISAIIIGIIVIVIIALGTIKEMHDRAYREEFRNFATESMDEHFTNVYADVVYIEPQYFLYKNYDLWEIICKCKTIEGKTIWTTIFYQYYPENNYSKDENNYKPYQYSANDPMRIIGSVDTAKQVADELERDIGNVFVLDVSETLNN